MFVQHYRGRCIGRIIDVLASYTSNMIARSVVFHQNGKITYEGEEFADYHFLEKSDVPIFDFKGKYVCFQIEQMKKFTEVLNEFRKLPWHEGDEQFKLYPTYIPGKGYTYVKI